MSATRPHPFPPAFSVDVVPRRDVVHVSPAGEVDLATVGAIRARVEELLSAGFTRVALHLRDVTFLDSSGLHLMLDLAAAADVDGWEFAVGERSPEVERVIDVAGLRAALPLVDAGTAYGHWAPSWR